MAYDDEQGFQLMRAPVARFLCRDWNARHPAEKQVVEFELIFCMPNKADSETQVAREQLLYLDLRDS
jgi:hypothetical protein